MITRQQFEIIKTQKAKEMSQIYYSREVEDDVIEKMIANLPFTEIIKQ